MNNWTREVISKLILGAGVLPTAKFGSDELYRGAFWTRESPYVPRVGLGRFSTVPYLAL